MRLRDTIALTLPSFLLRLVLGITFIWAGTGKLMGTMRVSGDDAARLANMGVLLDPVSPESTPTDPDPDPEQPPQPQAPLPEPTPNPTPDTAPEPSAEPSTDQPAQEPPQQPAQQPAKDTEKPAEVDETSDESRLGTAATRTHPPYRLTSVMQTSTDRTASDFPEPMECQRVYSIALMISKAADPGLTEDSHPIRPIMPANLADGHWPKTLAWAAAITEIGAGGFLLLGLLTRISALGTLSVMLVAMWMTQFGPAALHSSDAILGFIPNNQPWYDPGSYANLLWQLALASMSLAVVFLGSGPIGLDRLFFSSQPRDPYLHGDPKAGKKTGSNPAAAQRGEFDRSPSPTP